MSGLRIISGGTTGTTQVFYGKEDLTHDVVAVSWKIRAGKPAQAIIEFRNTVLHGEVLEMLVTP